MSQRYIAAIGEIALPVEDNEWLPHNDFTKAKDLWIKSNNSTTDSNYQKACKLVQKHFDASFDKSKMINYFANKVADVDEDGWSNVSAENIIYAKRKSIFKKYNDATYESEDLDSISVINLDFYERDYDDEPIESNILETPTISFILLKSIDLKDGIENQSDITKWEEKNNFDVLDCFNIEINENTCSYVDEDGYEGSSYSIEGGVTQTFLNEKGENIKDFTSRLNDMFIYGTTEAFEIDQEVQNLFVNLANGNLEEIKNFIEKNNTNVNLPLIDGVDITKPLSIVFSSAFFENDNFQEIFGGVFNLNDLNKKKNQEGLKECIFYLTAQGADLQQKIADLSYLAISINLDEEITEFLLSFGFDSERDSGVLALACEKGNLGLVEKFINLGASVEAKGNETSPLLYAAQGESEDKKISKVNQKNHIQIIEMLLKEGAKINHTDKGGDTALTNAVRCNNEDIVKYLIKAGIDVNGSKSKNAQIPIKIAHEKKFDNLVKILIAAGAKDTSIPPKIKKEKPSTKKTLATKKPATKKPATKKPPTKRAKPKKKPSNSYSSKKQSSGLFETAEGCFDAMDGCADLLKMLAIFAAVLWFFGALIWALFTS